MALVFGLLHGLLVAAITIVLAVVALLSGLLDRSGDLVVATARAWSKLVLTTGGVRVHSEHKAPLDPTRSYVFMANHASSVDIWSLFICLPVPIRMIAKQQLGRIPLFGWAMKAGRFIFIDRHNPAAARRSIAEAERRIRTGCSVVIFPEGTRTRDGRLGPFKKGGFHLAQNAGVPIVPVAIRGAGQVMPPGSLLMRPGHVRITVGEPIPTEGLGPAARDELVARVRRRIAEMSGQELA